MSALVEILNTTPRKGSRKNADSAINAEETSQLTPPRGSRKSSPAVSPARVRDEDIIGNKVVLNVEKEVIPGSPTRGKTTRPYEAPVSPGKSTTRRGEKEKSVLHVPVVKEKEDEEDDGLVTPKSNVGKSKEIVVNVLTRSPVRGRATATAKGGATQAEEGSTEEEETKSKSKSVAQDRRSASPLHANRLKTSARVEKVYSIIRSCTGTLGGNGTTGAIYGELTMGSMQRVINILVEKCGMNSSSRFIDVGSGLGKPNFHAAQDPQVRLSVGVELETIRWHLAMYNLQSVVGEMQRGKEEGEVAADVTKDTPLLSGVNFMAGDIDEAQSTDPFTHIYMYDLGFPPPLQQSIARKFNESQHAEYLVSYRPPRRVIEEYGYAVELVDQISTSMHGSGEGHMAYFYKRTSVAPKLTPAARTNSALKQLTLPARPGFSEKDEKVYCDAAFFECASLAVGELRPLSEHAREIVRVQLLSPTRSARTRTPTRITDV